MRTAAALASLEQLDSIVPYFGSAHGSGLSLLVTPFIRGQMYSNLLPFLDNSTWETYTARILAAGRTITAAAAAHLTEYSAQVQVTLSTLASPELAHFTHGLLDEPATDALAGAISRSGNIVPSPQHGDFWPGNVVIDGGRPVILDFEQFGLVTVPMYDVFHFLRTSSDIRLRSARRKAWTPWIRRLIAETAEGVFMRGVIDAEAQMAGVPYRSLPGLLTYYVLEIARRYHRRGTHYAHLLHEVRVLATMLKAGHIPLLAP
jgi:hypothetical protein